MIEFQRAPSFLQDVAEPRFVLWGWRKGENGKPTKPPLTARGVLASTTNPATWDTLEAAEKAFRQQVTYDGQPLDGLGYVLRDDESLVALDLDRCRDPKTREFSLWARHLIGRAGSYCELTPSGKGARIIGKMPAGGRDIHTTIEMDDGGQLEVFHHTARFITFTGVHVEGTPEGLADLSALVDEYCPEKAKPKANGSAEFNGTCLEHDLPPDLLRLVQGGLPDKEDRSAHFYRAVREMREYHWPLDAVIKLLELYPQGIAAKYSGRIAKEAARAYGKDSEQTPPKDNPRDKSTTGPRVLTSLQFAEEFVPPDYIVDQIIQQGYINSLTGRTGEGKTALCLYIAFCVARGVPFCDHETERGTVLYLAGENADDVRVRAIVMADRNGTTLDKLDVLWITAPYDLEKWHNVVTEKVVGRTIKLVIIDTASAYFPGDDENNNKQAGDYARLIRALFTALPGKPAVLVACHPTKRAADNDLIPRGGGAFLAEVDGNFTVAVEDDETIELAWSGKLRGPGFDPITLRIIRDVSCEQCKDTKGRPLRTAIAEPMTGEEVIAKMAQRRQDQDTLIEVMDLNPRNSIRDWAEFCRWATGKDNLPHTSKVHRLLNKLAELKLATKDRAGQWSLTPKGRELAKSIAGKVET